MRLIKNRTHSVPPNSLDTLFTITKTFVVLTGNPGKIDRLTRKNVIESQGGFDSEHSGLMRLTHDPIRLLDASA